MSSWTLAAGVSGMTGAERKEAMDELLALSRKSNSLVPLYLLGRSQYEEGDVESAIESLQKATEDKDSEHPNQLMAQSFLLLATIEKKRGNNDKAKSWADKSLNADLEFIPAKTFLNRL